MPAWWNVYAVALEAADRNVMRVQISPQVLNAPVMELEYISDLKSEFCKCKSCQGY